jgi:hypothetical protein
MSFLLIMTTGSVLAQNNQGSLQDGWGSSFKSKFNNAFEGDWGLDKSSMDREFSGKVSNENFGFDKNNMETGFNSKQKSKFDNFSSNFNEQQPNIDRDWNNNNLEQAEMKSDNLISEGKNKLQDKFSSFDSSFDRPEGNMDLGSKMDKINEGWGNVAQKESGFREGFSEIEEKASNFKGEMFNGEKLKSNIPDAGMDKNPYEDVELIEVPHLQTAEDMLGDMDVDSEQWSLSSDYNPEIAEQKGIKGAIESTKDNSGWVDKVNSFITHELW